MIAGQMRPTVTRATIGSLAVLAAVALFVPAVSAGAPRYCGTIRDGVTAVSVSKGNVSCKRARTVAASAIKRGKGRTRVGKWNCEVNVAGYYTSGFCKTSSSRLAWELNDLGRNAGYAAAARGADCGRIAVRNVRDGRTKYRVYAVGGKCSRARNVMRDWAKSTYEEASAGVCTTNTCTDAPPPSGYECRNVSAGEEARTGLVQECRRGSRRFRSYSS